MKSQAISKNKLSGYDSGFTLIEIMVVIFMMIIIGGASIYFGMDSFRGYSYHSNRDTLIAALQHARAEAMANLCRGTSCIDGKPYGVAVHPSDHPNSYVVFQTESSNPTYLDRTEEDKDADALIDSSANINSGEIVFSPASGETVDGKDSTFIITDNEIHSSSITINREGQITWTN